MPALLEHTLPDYLVNENVVCVLIQLSVVYNYRQRNEVTQICTDVCMNALKEVVSRLVIEDISH